MKPRKELTTLQVKVNTLSKLVDDIKYLYRFNQEKLKAFNTFWYEEIYHFFNGYYHPKDSQSQKFRYLMNNRMKFINCPKEWISNYNFINMKEDLLDQLILQNQKVLHDLNQTIIYNQNMNNLLSGAYVTLGLQTIYETRLIVEAVEKKRRAEQIKQYHENLLNPCSNLDILQIYSHTWIS